MTEHAVVIAGGGPTGMMLGAELTLAGVDVVIVERRVDKVRIQPGALGLHARTIEVFDQRGIADRFLAEGKAMQVMGFAGVHFDISAFPSRHPYGLALIQKHSERILLNWAEELGVPFLRGVEVTGFAEDASGIHVALSDGRSLRAHYLVGCDGGRSLVRKAAGIAFPGSDPTLIADPDAAGPGRRARAVPGRPQGVGVLQVPAPPRRAGVVGVLRRPDLRGRPRPSARRW